MGQHERWPGALFDDPATDQSRAVSVLRTADGEQIVLDRTRWYGPPGREEQRLLGRARGSVLDVGCGPARHVLALVSAGRWALGIDTSAEAVAIARRRGAPALRASVFGRVPGAGTWGTVLLLDGNIGIGGNPLMLLPRVHGLLSRGGVALLEVERPGGADGRVKVRVEHGGRHGRWFPWARVPVTQIDGLADATGFSLADVWVTHGRWFAEIRRTGRAPSARLPHPSGPGGRPVLKLVAPRPVAPAPGVIDGRPRDPLSERRG
jgi:SAM-dependent methyltransferase